MGYEDRIDIEIDLEDHESDVVSYVQRNKSPEDVFPKGELNDWAEDNGWVRESELDDAKNEIADLEARVRELEAEVE